VDLVTRGAKFSGLGAHEGLQKSTAVRLRIYAHQKIVESANHGIVAGGQFVQLGIFQDKIALTHVLLTCTMLWHIRQLRPALASGRSTSSLMGLSNKR